VLSKVWNEMKKCSCCYELKSDGGYEKDGLVRGENELELYLMAEIPSNILMVRRAVHIDGFLLEVMI
jgi:hypothetical protein